MTSNNFYYAITLLETIYGLSIQEEDFEEIGLLAWNQIGNKRCRLYKQTICLDSCENSLELPCNCDILEAVTSDFEDFQHVSNVHDRALPGSFSTESYIESNKRFKNPLYISGKFIPYNRVGNMLYFDKHYDKVNILYKGVELDEVGLPALNDKEAMAIATYVAYILKFKEGMRTANNNILQLSNVLKQEWLKQCDQARVPEEMSQNEWDMVLDAKNNWNRKIQGLSYKPVR